MGEGKKKKNVMKLEYKQFNFAKILYDIDSTLSSMYDKIVPKKTVCSKFKEKQSNHKEWIGVVYRGHKVIYTKKLHEKWFNLPKSISV